MKKFIRMFFAFTLVLSLMPVSYAAAEEQTSSSDGSVKCSIISEPGDLQNLIDTDVPYSSQDVITTDWSGTSSPHKVVVNEEGWLFITIFEKEKHTNCTLYSNFALTSEIAKAEPFTGSNTLACYVQPGSYYYQISRWNGFDPSTTTSYVGFMPATSRIKVDKIDYSSDKSKATVTFDYDEEYLPNFLDGTIRVVKGAVSYKDITNNDVWKVENRENALEKNAFVATSNGTYTARIAGNDNNFCAVTFEITDLVSSSPKTPKISSFSSGSNTVSGTGLEGSKIYVTIGGKTYSDTVNSEGKWSVSRDSSLKKGTKIKAYVKNEAGLRSKTTTVTVK